MKLCTLSTGDAVYRYNRSVVVVFEQGRKILSTSLFKGGYHEDLTAVFNHNVDTGPDMNCALRAPTYQEHMRLVATELGLDPDTVSGMGTAASMDNVAISSQAYENLTVTAIVTGGVEVNGGRVGDPAAYFQSVDKRVLHKPGTINIMLAIDSDLPPGVLARALVTCTEAKTAALQELMAGSNYSTGLATGSGTDQTIIMANPASSLYLESAGKHSKLGELIGLTVKQAVKEALLRQNGLSPRQQHSVLRRMKRFGITEEGLWRRYEDGNGGDMEQAEFLEHMRRLDEDPHLVTCTSLYIHLLDQFLWELLSAEEVAQAGHDLLALASARFGLAPPRIEGAELQDYVLAWAGLVIQMVQGAIAEGKIGH